MNIHPWTTKYKHVLSQQFYKEIKASLLIGLVDNEVYASYITKYGYLTLRISGNHSICTPVTPSHLTEFGLINRCRKIHTGSNMTKLCTVKYKIVIVINAWSYRRLFSSLKEPLCNPIRRILPRQKITSSHSIGPNYQMTRITRLVIYSRESMIFLYFDP